MVAIDDPEVVRMRDTTHYPNIALTGQNENCAPGAMFEISDAELAHADQYEVDVRVLAPLVSGLEAWDHLDALQVLLERTRFPLCVLRQLPSERSFKLRQLFLISTGIQKRVEVVLSRF